jgi:hypothetical protein
MKFENSMSEIASWFISAVLLILLMASMYSKELDMKIEYNRGWLNGFYQSCER